MSAMHRYCRRFSLFVAASLYAVAATEGGCFQSDIAKRFREAYTPGAVAGLSAALEDPANAEAGFRQSGSALLDGLGAILVPRTPSSSGTSTTSGSTGR